MTNHFLESVPSTNVEDKAAPYHLAGDGIHTPLTVLELLDVVIGCGDGMMELAPGFLRGSFGLDLFWGYFLPKIPGKQQIVSCC